MFSLMEKAFLEGDRHWTRAEIDSHELWIDHGNGPIRKLWIKGQWTNVVQFEKLLPLLNLLARDQNPNFHDIRAISLYVNEGRRHQFGCVMEAVRPRQLEHAKVDSHGQELLPTADEPPRFGAEGEAGGIFGLHRGDFGDRSV